MTKQQEGTPTMADVEEMTLRLEALKAKEAALAIKEEGLAAEIADAHVHGMDQKALDLLTYSRREAKEDREDASEAIPLLQAKIKEQRETACKSEAEKRMTGIARGFGSLRQELDEDVEKALTQAKVYAEAVGVVNDRYRALMLLRGEASGLSDRFAVGAPAFSPVVIPSLRGGCNEASLVVDGARFVNHYHIAPATAKCAHGLRTRRSYREVSGTPTATIIEAAGGAKPWPPLTPKQHEIVESRERDRQAQVRDSKRFATEGERALQRTGILLGGAGGGR